VLLDDGLIGLTVESVEGDLVNCRIENTNEIGERKGINLPNASVDLPAMSEKDMADIEYGIEKDMDFVAASFVRTAAQVNEIRAHIELCMTKHWPAGHVAPQIISKIESQEAVDNFEEILEVSDGIMVARGDLGVEVPLEEVVLMQKMMVQQCNEAGKPVIVATQMLETMQKNPRPTRAEVSDVTNAVLDGADALMLSGESANGSFPIEAIEMMNRIIYATEDNEGCRLSMMPNELVGGPK
jgi:pyruvate kinase